RKPHPKEVKHHALGDYCAQSYWVRITGLKEPEAEVRATIKEEKKAKKDKDDKGDEKEQVIEFTATGAKQVTFYIDETLLDLSKPIKVKSGASTLFDKEVKPSV